MYDYTYVQFKNFLFLSITRQTLVDCWLNTKRLTSIVLRVVVVVASSTTLPRARWIISIYGMPYSSCSTKSPIRDVPTHACIQPHTRHQWQKKSAPPNTTNKCRSSSQHTKMNISNQHACIHTLFVCVQTQRVSSSYFQAIYYAFY